MNDGTSDTNAVFGKRSVDITLRVSDSAHHHKLLDIIFITFGALSRA